MAAYESLNDQQMRDYLEMVKTVHGIEFHPEGSMTLPTGHRVAAAGDIEINLDGFTTNKEFTLVAGLIPETGAMHTFAASPETSRYQLFSPRSLQTRSGNLKGVTSLDSHAGSFTKENVSELLSGYLSEPEHRASNDSWYLEEVRNTRGMLAVSERTYGSSPIKRMFNLREQRFED